MGRVGMEMYVLSLCIEDLLLRPNVKARAACEHGPVVSKTF